jgi:hypothetical protein
VASAEITPAPVNFAAAGRNYTFLAHMAAATLDARGIDALVVNADNIAALDEAEFPIPLGECRFIVVGQPAFDLLPERTQQFVFDPPQPDKSDYFGAVGTEVVDPVQNAVKSPLRDTEDKLVEILELLGPPTHGKGGAPGAGDEFLMRIRALKQNRRHLMETVAHMGSTHWSGVEFEED